MKKVKRLASLILAFVLAFVLAVPAFAATVNNETGHEYKAYQIFTGTQASDDVTGALAVTGWGSGVDGATFLAELKTANADLYGNANSAAEVAAVLSENNSNSEVANEFAKIAEKHIKKDQGIDIAADAELTAGYYLFVDQTTTSGKDDVKGLSLLQVTQKGDIELKSKNDKPSVEKKVKENLKNVSGNKDDRIPDYELSTGYNDVADYNIGDDVPFELIGTLPQNLDLYNTYKYIFHDTLSAGLTYKEGSLKVYVVDTEKDTENDDNVIPESAYKLTVANQKIEVAFDNIKSVDGVAAGKKIVVKYEATLNKNAEIGLDGNKNEVYLQYSNNPNNGGEGDTGETPKDEVLVFTYELDVTKIDGATAGDNPKKLAGAKFVLKNSEGKYVQVDADGKVTGWVDTEPNPENQEDAAGILTSNDDGLFKVIGLDAGTYYLKEVVAPAGYNILKDEIELKVLATTKNDQNWTSGNASDALTALKIKVGTGDETDGDVNSGIVSATVQNNKGGTLPETGGIGTTIFYLTGTILVLGAVVLLITKKRMENAEK
ncbi:isopeptide-forming domain-containing fimbrial protein [Brotaphodocola sp.]|uniref:isopeptide-forming domain-containing fimbrial protein n=1 Tax=Brotaphodocola sp. TaxID=3073577 RepID=UPI003D7DD38A